MPTRPAVAPAQFEERLRYWLRYCAGAETPDVPDFARALCCACRELLADRLLETEQRYQQRDAKRVYYLSMEFLIGRLLRDVLLNLGLHESAVRAAERLGFSLDAALEAEPDAALGNGGLGRLAACYLESMASLGMAGFGYGILYEYGLFRQEIRGGEQVERPDHWLRHGTPWVLERPHESVVVPLYGRVDDSTDRHGAYNPMWLDWKVLIGVPHDLPVAGYGGVTVNYLRLYAARASDEFDMGIFNAGDYLRAVEQKIASETISKVLYPSDAIAAGKELRLIQEYFLVACAVRDIVRRFQRRHADFREFPARAAIQINDTHPALAIAELMRLLVDEQDLPWEAAWDCTQAVFGYTNHTLMREALETWPVPLLAHVLPRHLQIVYEINRRFLDQVAARYPGDLERLRRMSLIEEGEVKQVRMAHLAIAGSHSVNGVAAVHSELVKRELVPDFCEFWPQRFNNKTNGVTHRRWLLYANPRLAGLITEALGERWKTDLERLRDLAPLAGNAAFRESFRRVKHDNKVALAARIAELTGERVDPDSLFDVQVKRIHEYKRQLLNALRIIADFCAVAEDGRALPAPRTYLFAGKAAPGYFMAKRIIHLIHALALRINLDPRLQDRMKVVFLPDYRVSLAEQIIPAADLSEQISTAGTEASGTGNMKLALNGALTVGTLDGANVEIREEVGEENVYIFGLTVEQVRAHLRERSYRPWERYHHDPVVRRVLDRLVDGTFGEASLFQPLFDALLPHGDYYFHLADLPPYLAVQQRIAEDFLQPEEWAARAIRNVAGMGKFTSDRAVAEYARDIWGLPAA